MSQFTQWLTLGGYASYVWSAYGLVGTVLVLMWSGIKWRRMQIRKQLQRWLQRQMS